MTTTPPSVVEAGTPVACRPVVLTCLDLTPEMVGELENLGVTGLVLNSWLHDYRPTPSTLEYKLSRIEQFAGSFF